MSSPQDRSESRADDVLRRGLRTAPLSAQALQRIRAAAEAEWRAQSQAPSPTRARWKIAAALVLLAGASVIGVLNYRPAGAEGAVVATLQRSVNPGLEIQQAFRAAQPLAMGADLRVAANVAARGDALLALAGGGNLRVARGATFEFTDDHTLRLQGGEIYVDMPPGGRTAAAFVVRTPSGEFQHVGTQFSVAVDEGRTRLRVREGSVVWRGEEGARTVNAGVEVLMDRREISRQPLPLSGPQWAWTETLAPDVDIDNRPVRVFLEWFARESGRRLELADAAARSQVDTILMHGNVRGLTPLQALQAVMAATSLHYELPEGVIRVSSAGDSQPRR